MWPISSVQVNAWLRTLPNSFLKMMCYGIEIGVVSLPVLLYPKLLMMKR